LATPAKTSNKKRLPSCTPPLRGRIMANLGLLSLAAHFNHDAQNSTFGPTRSTEWSQTELHKNANGNKYLSPRAGNLNDEEKTKKNACNRWSKTVGSVEVSWPFDKDTSIINLARVLRCLFKQQLLVLSQRLTLPSLTPTTGSQKSASRSACAPDPHWRQQMPCPAAPPIELPPVLR